MFEVDGVYANRNGKYTVIALDPPKMHVRYENGSYSELNMKLQERIWLNIKSELDAEQAKLDRAANVVRRGIAKNQHFIKVISLPVVNELLFPGWHERMLMASNPIQASRINPGDRVICYAMEANSFFAVATITGAPKIGNPKDYTFTIAATEAHFLPIDIDALVQSADEGVDLDSVELEDYPDFKNLLAQPENFISISEDDFELLAELLTELSEDDDSLDADDDFDDEEDED